MNQPANQHQAGQHQAMHPQAAAIDIEICVNCDDLQHLATEVRTARAAGAKRLELCGAMQEQGLTPTVEAVRIARQAWGVMPGLVAMLRPRGGDFYYQAAEAALLQQQMADLAAAGADAIVLGVLRQTSTGAADIDWPLLEVLIAQAKAFKLEVNFHRAFDVLPFSSRALALQRLHQTGVARVLTAGCAWHSGLGAADGVLQLQQELRLVAADAAPKLVVGGGVSLANTAWLRSQLDAGQSAPATYSFHCYSAVLTDGRIDRQKVATLVATAARPHTLS